MFAHSAEAPHWPVQPCDIFGGNFLRKPQSIALTVLVTIEMLKALSAVSLEASVFRIPPWKNRWLLAGVSVPMMLHCAVLYVPILNNLFGLSPLSKNEWKVKFEFEILRLFIR